MGHKYGMHLTLIVKDSDEESKLKTDNHQQLLVDGIVKGIDQYFSDDSSTEESNGAT